MNGPAYLQIVLRDPDSGAETAIGRAWRTERGWAVSLSIGSVRVEQRDLDGDEDIAAVVSMATAAADLIATEARRRLLIAGVDARHAERVATAERRQEGRARQTADAQVDRPFPRLAPVDASGGRQGGQGAIPAGGGTPNGRPNGQG